MPDHQQQPCWLDYEKLQSHDLYFTSIQTGAYMYYNTGIWSSSTTRQIISTLFIHWNQITTLMMVTKIITTRTTRTPAFWDTPHRPMITHTSGSHQIPSQNKIRQSQSYTFKKNAKNSNFAILQETLNATHLLRMLGEMYKYKMDLTRTIGVTERTRDAGRTDGQTDGRSETNIPPNNFVVFGV